MSPQPGQDPDSDVEAMTRIARGDDLALNEIMDRWTPRLDAYLARFLGNESDATDLVQETFVAVYRARFRYRPTAKFSTWVFGIASNLARQKLRWRKRHPEVALDLELEQEETGPVQLDHLAENPSIKMQAKETATTVRSAVMSLPAELREPLVLGVYEELPQAEIAEILGCSTKTVETRLYRARQLLRKRLCDHLK
jgi:RNA polymerase sigma-70 factor (ECF subfamily)